MVVQQVASEIAEPKCQVTELPFWISGEEGQSSAIRRKGLFHDSHPDDSGGVKDTDSTF